MFESVLVIAVGILIGGIGLFFLFIGLCLFVEKFK